MGKIGDLWVKLGLKNDGLKKGVNEAKGVLSAFSGSLGRLAAMAKSAWAAVAVAIGKFATDAVKLTQRWGDQWAVTMAGIRGAYQSFVRDLSSGAGWSELFTNMRDAWRDAREVAAALDEIFERKTSFQYDEAETRNRIADLETIARDTRKSDEERKAAIAQIKKEEEDLAARKKAIWADEAAEQRRRFQQASKLNDAQTDFLVKNYNENREAINQARKYGEERIELEKKVKEAQRNLNVAPASVRGFETQKLQEAQAALAALDAKTSDTTKSIYAMTQGYDRANDELVTKMADAEVAVINIDTAMKQAVRSADRIEQRLDGGTPISGGAGGSTSAEDASLQQAQAIQARLEQAAKSEVQILREKYEDEKALLEKHGMDTERLTQEYLAALIADAVEPGLEDITDATKDLEPVEIEPLKIGKTTGVEEWIAELERLTEIAEERAKEFQQAVVGGFSDGIQELTDQLFGLQEVNAGAIMMALLGPLADMAIKEGEIVMMQGLAIEAIKSALESLNGPAAIAAGAALIAVGAAVKSGLGALANTNGSAAASTATAYGGGSSAAQLQTIDSELTIYVKGEIDGSNIVLAGERTMNDWNR